MSKIQSSGLSVNNHTEQIVNLVMRGFFHTHPEVCACSLCRNDIARLVLNNLATAYSRRLTRIRTLEDVDEEYLLEVMNEVYRAVNEVRSNQNHSESQELSLCNQMEDIVFEALEDIVSHGHDFCVCQRCVEQILVVALEQLPAQYVSSGGLPSQDDVIDPQLSSKVLVSLHEAVQRVKLRPPH